MGTVAVEIKRRDKVPQQTASLLVGSHAIKSELVGRPAKETDGHEQLGAEIALASERVRAHSVGGGAGGDYCERPPSAANAISVLEGRCS